MFNPKRFLSLFVLMFFVCGFTVSADATATCGDAQDSFAEVMFGSSGINFMPKVSYAEFVVTVARADGSVFQKTFETGSTPYLDMSSICGATSQDGIYSFELRVIPTAGQKVRGSVERAGLESIKQYQRAMVQTGSFSVQNGAIVPPSGAQEGLSRTQDVLHYDDVIITGSLCVGWDCANGESFGYCTIKLKENNLQLCFEDTSIGSFPTNDWKIQINDTTSGGASYFTLWDTDGGRRPFTIEAGAPAHSLYVEDYGRVGLGTSIPYVELHIVDGDSPTIRLDQDGSSGWTAQRWDLCGNETNFFIRDVTNGSKLCFRIQPNTPSNTLCMRSTGYVGIGTWSPAAHLHIEDNEATKLVLYNTTADKWIFNAAANGLRFTANDSSTILMRLTNTGDLFIEGDITADGTCCADFVFDPDYNLMPMEDLAEFVKNERHLPEIPSATEMKEKGVNVTQLQIKLLQKVEELTLYTLSQEETIKAQKQAIKELQERLAALENKDQ